MCFRSLYLVKGFTGSIFVDPKHTPLSNIPISFASDFVKVSLFPHILPNSGEKSNQCMWLCILSGRRNIQWRKIRQPIIHVSRWTLLLCRQKVVFDTFLLLHYRLCTWLPLSKVNISLLPTNEKVNLNFKITSHQLHFSNLFLVHNYTKCLIVDQERVFIWCFVKDVNLDEGAIAFRDRSARIKSWDSSCWVGAAQIT